MVSQTKGTETVLIEICPERRLLFLTSGFVIQTLTITVNYPHQVQEISTIPSSSLPYAAAALEQWMAIDQCRRDLRGSHSNSKTGTKTTSSPDPFC